MVVSILNFPSRTITIAIITVYAILASVLIFRRPQQLRLTTSPPTPPAKVSTSVLRNNRQKQRRAQAGEEGLRRGAQGAPGLLRARVSREYSRSVFPI